MATGQWESAGSAVDHDRIDTCLLRSRRAVADRGNEKPAQDRRPYEQFQLPSHRLCPMFPEAPLLRVQQTPGVQRCSGLIDEFHGGHYRPGPSGAASPDWGIGAHVFEFSCSVAWGPQRGRLPRVPRLGPGEIPGSKEIQGGVAQALNGRGTPARHKRGAEAGRAARRQGSHKRGAEGRSADRDRVKKARRDAAPTGIT